MSYLILRASKGFTNLHIGKSVRDIYSIAFEFIIILYLIGRLDSFAIGDKNSRGAGKYADSAGNNLRIFSYIMISVLHYLSP